MNTTLARDRLRDPLAQAKAATHPRDETCRLVLARCAADGTLTLQGTDKESACTLTVREVAVEEPGACLLPDLVGSILGTAPAGDVRLKMDGDKLVLTTLPDTPGERNYRLPTATVDGFPEVAAPEGEPQVECAAADLRTALERVEFAAADADGTKYKMNGVGFDFGPWARMKGKCRLVATDSKSLAVANLEAVERGTFPTGIRVVPEKAVAKALTLLDDLDAGTVCGLSFCDNTFTLTTPDGWLWSCLLVGKFPPYRDVVSKDGKFKIPLVAGSFLDAVKAAAVMSEEESRRVEFVFKKGLVTMQARGDNTGEGKVPLALPDYSGEEVKVFVDPMYLTRFFRVLDEGEAVELRIVDGQKSIVFGYASGAGLCLVVPLV